MPRLVPRQRKHKVIAREKTHSQTSTSTVDPNATQIIPPTKSEKADRRAQLREELRAQHDKISSKKQKRLDKYIEKKLKRDENQDFLRRLEKEKEKFDVGSSNLQSSKTLGKRTFGQYASDVAVSANGDDAVASTPKKEKPRDEDSDMDSEDSFEEEHRIAFENGAASKIQEPVSKANSIAIGSGLAKPLELGPNGLPIIQMRPGRKRTKIEPAHIEASLEESLTKELPWDGFESENGEDEVYDDEEGEEDDSGSPSEGESRTDEADDSEDSDDSEISREDGRIKPRQSAFKSWATQKLNESIGHTPSYITGDGELKPPPKSEAKNSTTNHVKTSTTTPPTLTQNVETKPNRFAYNISVNRPEEIQKSRADLPISQKEQEIMEAIYNNSTIILKGDTGSGKTTQIPQFLFEAGFGSPGGPYPGMIGITQPRRVAAVSMANRVGQELGEHKDKVAYQIRFDSNVSPKTAVKFMTDGILLRELSQDLLLQKYSAIVIDEAHERSINTDILIGMLSRIVPARARKDEFNPNPRPLKLIIMSATLNIGDFIHDKLFKQGLKPPIVEAEGRQHGVTTHFALRSRADYLDEVVEKVKRAHRKLPRGGILVFLTGQQEIKTVGDQLRKALNIRAESDGPSVCLAATGTPLETEDYDFGVPVSRDDVDDFEVDIVTQSDEEAEEKEFEISDDEDEDKSMENNRSQRPVSIFKPQKVSYTSAQILPLYSQLPTKEQMKVFEPIPDDVRMIVLATNVAETSLTIPGIRFVFDCGRSKERKYNLDTGVQSFEVDYISKASAQQRAGRAGRTGPGHCWRLYTSAIYERYFADYAEPEILRAPAESIVLQLKSFHYPKPVSQFPFPAAPAKQTLDNAERLLRNLGALDLNGSITDLGHHLALFPLSPRLGKILSLAIGQPELIGHAISLVAGLAVSEIFINESLLNLRSQTSISGTAYMEDDEDDESRNARKQEYGRAKATLSKNDKASDAGKLLTAVTIYTEASNKEQVCNAYFLRFKALSEVAQLQSQLRSIVKTNFPTSFDGHKQALKMPAKLTKQINALAAGGYIDQVAIRADLSPNPPEQPQKPRRAIDVPYLPLIPLITTHSSSTSLHEKAIFIHPSSVLSRFSPNDLPQFIIYTHLHRSQSRTISSANNTEINPTKTRMFPLTPIDAATLADLAAHTALIRYGKPVPKTKIEELPGRPKRRVCWVTTELHGGAAGAFGWPLNPVRVRQVSDLKAETGWRVEEVLR